MRPGGCARWRACGRKAGSRVAPAGFQRARAGTNPRTVRGLGSQSKVPRLPVGIVACADVDRVLGRRRPRPPRRCPGTSSASRRPRRRGRRRFRPTVAPAGLYCAWGTRKRPLFVSTENSGSPRLVLRQEAENVTEETVPVNVPLIIVMFARLALVIEPEAVDLRRGRDVVRGAVVKDQLQRRDLAHGQRPLRRSQWTDCPDRAAAAARAAAAR